MPKRKSPEIFIEEVKKIHGDKYDYSLTKYEKYTKKVKIICLNHGVFEQYPGDHLKGCGCPICSNRKSNKNIFISKSKEIHGSKYDYSLVDYVNNNTKIKIICPSHGIFTQEPNAHLNKQGCPKCSNNYNYTTDEFIEKLKNVHGDKYDYSLVVYSNNRNDIKIICPSHGVFQQNSYTHLSGFGCSKCSNNHNYTTDEFIEKSKGIHGDKYDYSMVKYINSNTKIDIICKHHGVFSQQPYTHLQNTSCPSCNESKGEKNIKKILIKNNIYFEEQKSFTNLKYINFLYFDFYLPEHNIAIEYDGQQHFHPIKNWGGDNNLKIIQKRDKIKNEYCKTNNIHLIRIKYNENIQEKLIHFLF